MPDFLRTGDSDLPVGELLARYLPRLRAFVRLRIGAQLRALESSMDLAQSVCRELLENAEDFEYRGEKEFLTWLFRSALNKVRERHRFHHREKRDIDRRLPVDVVDVTVGADYRTLLTPSREAIAREDIDCLERAFDELTDDHREVLTLSRIIGMSNAEIAEQIGRSQLAVRKLTGRAMVALGKAMRRSEQA